MRIKENFNREKYETDTDHITTVLNMSDDERNPYILGIRFTEKYRKYLTNTYGDLEQDKNTDKTSVVVLLGIEEIQRIPGMENLAQLFTDRSNLYKYWSDIDKYDIVSVEKYNLIRRAATLIKRQFGDELEIEIVRVPQTVIRNLEEDEIKNRFKNLREKMTKYQAGIILNTDKQEQEYVAMVEQLKKQFKLNTPTNKDVLELKYFDLITKPKTKAQLEAEIKNLKSETVKLIENIIIVEAE